MVIRFLLGHKVLSGLLAVALLLAVLLAWDGSARLRGQLAAHFDLARGEYKVLTWGLPGKGSARYFQRLRQRYGIGQEAIAGCGVSRSVLAYADGYNTVVWNAAIRRFGRDIFKEPMANPDAGH